MGVSTVGSHTINRNLSNAQVLEEYTVVKDTHMVAEDATDTHMVVAMVVAVKVVEEEVD